LTLKLDKANISTSSFYPHFYAELIYVDILNMITTAKPTPSRIEHFPISFFSVVMGLAGLTIATHKFEASSELTHSMSHVLFYIAAGLWGLIALRYAYKAIRFPSSVVEEWRHPVRLSFFPSSTIGLILLSIAAAPISEKLAYVLWILGAGGHLLMTLAVISSWLQQEHFEIHHSSPAWFIPVVGNILVPIVGVKFAHIDVSWFFFSIGILFWAVLLTIIFNRLIFHTPLPGKLVPTLAILLAPPSVGFLAWYKLVGQVDAFAHILYGSAIFFFLLLLAQLPRFSRQNFALSWWAYTFPLAAFNVSTFVMAEVSGNLMYTWLGKGLYGALVLLIIGITARTLIAIYKNEICVAE